MTQFGLLDSMKFRLSTLLLIPTLIAAFFGGRSAHRSYFEYPYVQEIKASAEIREKYLKKSKVPPKVVPPTTGTFPYYKTHPAKINP